MVVIRIVAVDCSALLNPSHLEAMLPYLDDERRQRVRRLANPEKQTQCAAAGWLLTTLLGENGVPPTLFHGSRGKPYLQGRDDLFFSLAHTGRWVFCALAPQEIGLDAQMAGPCNQRVADRCFTPDEKRWMDEDPDGRFTRLWTLKEAYLKYTGFGLVLPMSSFTVPLPAGGWDDTTHCFWQETTLTTPEDTVHVAVCAAAEDTVAPIEIRTLP